MKIIVRLLLVMLLLNSGWAMAQRDAVFKVVPLGVKGGSDESNLSCYAVSAQGANEYVCLDAGTINYGIQKAMATGAMKGTDASEIQKAMIKGYLISHPHLDHVAGLIMNAPEDSPKNIYGMPACLDVLKDKYFSWKNWANFGDDGDKPALGKYHYVPLTEGAELPLQNTTMSVKAFVLSHSAPYQSTAFLIKSEDNYLLYLGDTGSDEIEKSDKMHKLWEAVGPLIKSKQLKAIFIEVSFANEQPDKSLFGHLTPRLLMNEMKVLNGLSDNMLKNFPIVITHRKPAGDREEKIKQQLLDANALQVKLVFPEQGKNLGF